MRKRSNKVIGYLRVSTEEQAISGLGIADQKDVISNEANKRGWSDLTFMADEGFSAKNLDRPSISTALYQLQRGEASVLVVSKLDRLSRSLLDFALLMETAKKQGWEIVVLDCYRHHSALWPVDGVSHGRVRAIRAPTNRRTD